MNNIVETVYGINDIINSFVWGPVMICVFLLIGIWFTLRTKFFQLVHIRMWMKKTILSALSDKSVRKTSDKGAVSQLQALCSSLAACVGTGNIVGVATAIYLGGAGAVFWMWISAFFGMMTSYAENILGIKYRYKNEKGEWVGGAMVYIERGLKSPLLAKNFSILCILVSFGMGNMTQINSISVSMKNSFGVPVILTGIIITLITAVIISGGMKRIASATEKIVPFMALTFLIMTLIVIFMNFKNIPYAFKEIITGAFSIKAASGGVAGISIGKTIKYGISRGVFSNEAGLGSSAIIHSASDVKEPCIQGMWGIFEVFTDTIVMCTLTALVIICSKVNITCNTNGADLSSLAFENALGKMGGKFVTISITLFAFATIIGWSYYGEKATEYIFGLKAVKAYRIIFVAIVMLGSVLDLELVWSISDTLNGLMAIPNLIAITAMSREVLKEHKRFMKNRAKPFANREN